MADELTICAVAYKSRTVLESNWTLTATLNPHTQFRWLVVENSPEGSSQRIEASGDQWTVIPGGNYASPLASYASYNHAYGLHRMLELVQTPFVLVMDPDFMIVRKDWIPVVLAYMRQKHLVFFGAPYHPSRYLKYRYFPSVTCLFVDLSQIAKSDLDFVPPVPDQSAGVENTPVPKVPAITPPGIRRLVAFFDQATRHHPVLRRAASTLYSYTIGLHERMAIGRSRDTGYRIYEKFAKRVDTRTEYLIPVYRDADLSKDLIIRPLLPDRLCYVPKRKGYFSATGFRERGAFDLSALGWEEYLWNNEPFGFHIRGVSHGFHRVNKEELLKILNTFRH